MKKKWVKWFLVLIWMTVIFKFSSQNGLQSNDNNRFIVDVLKSIGINLDVIIGTMDNYIIRKLAHMSEYFILFLLIYNAIYEAIKLEKALIVALLITFIYAGSDEFHQSFIIGRAGMFKDVLIDTFGGSLALASIVTIHALKSINKRNK